MIKTGAMHLDSLRDGRAVYIGGEKVADRVRPVLLDLLARLGVDDPALQDRARAFREQNVSPTYVQMELIRHATRLGLNSKMRRRWINNRHMRRLSDATLPDTWDDLILNFSARGNAYVNRTYLTDTTPGLPVSPAEEERDPG